MQSSRNLDKTPAKKQPKQKRKCYRRMRQQERKAKYNAQGREDWKYLEAS